MARFSVQIHINAPPDRLWASLADIKSHTRWMSDALKIRFIGEKRRGVGTRFSCKTRVGIFVTNDVMEVTEWVENEAMGVHHTGLISGSGRFEIIPAPQGSVFRWKEELRFPLWLGGALTAAAAKPILTRIWRRNLHRLKTTLEGGAAGAP